MTSQQSPGCTTPGAERRHSDDSPEPEMELPYPEYEPRALWLLDQTTRPRTWCLVLINWPYPLIVARAASSCPVRADRSNANDEYDSGREATVAAA